MKGVLKTKRPKMTNHRGRTWDVCDVILHDGVKVQGHLDTSWGERFYFEIEGQWYTGSIGKYEQRGGDRWVMTVDLRNPDPNWDSFGLTNAPKPI